jgi:chromosome partitioning protein
VIDADPNGTLSRWHEKFRSYPLTVEHQIDENEILPAAERLEADHDLLLIDTAGFGNRTTVFAFGAADLVVIPAQPSSSDIDEAIKTTLSVQSAARMARREIAYRLLLTKAKTTSVTKHALEQLEARRIPLLRSALSDLTAYREITWAGTVPTDRRAAPEIRDLLAELAGFGLLPFYKNTKIPSVLGRNGDVV